MIKAVLFDLDGTLLPMDQDAFTEGYFRLLAQKLLPYGYEKGQLIAGIWHGTAVMVHNDGSCSNEEAFWKDFVQSFGERCLKDKALFDEFYASDFQKAKELCGYTPKAANTVNLIWELGRRVILATNPIFPSVATESRIRWAGLAPEDFELYTTYENIGYCKPNLDYYREILRRLKLKPEDCLMVGNDVDEDMVASKIGLPVFLLTDCLINRHNQDIEDFPHGDFDDLIAYLLKELRPW